MRPGIKKAVTGGALALILILTSASAAGATAADSEKYPTQIQVSGFLDRRLSYQHGEMLDFGGTLYWDAGISTVSVAQKAAGAEAWTTIGRAVTDTTGQFTFLTKVHITSRYRFTFAGNDTHQGSMLEVAGPKVQAGVHKWTKDQSGRRGVKTTFVLQVDPAPRKVTLQWHDYPDGPGWRNMVTTTANPSGIAKVSFTPKKAGRYRLRIMLAGDARAVGSVTGPKFLTVG